MEMRTIHKTKEGNFFDKDGEYIPAIPQYSDISHAKREQSKEKAPRGINMWNTFFLLLIQMAMMVAYVITVSQDRYA